MGNGEKTILKLEQIVKKYKTKGSFFGPHGKDVIALNGVSLEILRGEIFGLVGESGSGKTTVGRLIVKLEEPEEGKISLDGNETTLLRGKALRDLRREVQMIFQDPYQSLNPQLSVFDTISEPLIIHKLGNAQARETAVWETLKSVVFLHPMIS